MGRRGFQYPTIASGSHPPPYMSLQADLKEAVTLLEEIERISKSHASAAVRVGAIRGAINQWRSSRQKIEEARS